jgi:lipopolysaccharide biosynthesis regulator YciM
VSWLLVVILALVVVALYPVVRDFLRKRRSAVPAYVEGLQAALDGRSTEAIAKLKETVSSDTANVDAYIRLGDLFLAQGETERGIKVHENLALRRNLDKKEERKVLLALVRDYLKTDRRVKAVAILEELVHLDRNDAASVERLAEAYIETGAWDKCEALLKELVKNPANRQRSSRLYARLGRASARTNPTGAKSAFDTALRLDPGCLYARVHLGDYYLSQGDTQEAIKTWNELLDAAPDQNALVRARLERAYFDAGRFEDVTRLYEKLLRRVPDDAGLAVALAEIYQKKEDLPAALRLLEKFGAGRKAGPEIQVALASLYLDKGDPTRAREVLGALLEKMRHETPSKPVA